MGFKLRHGEKIYLPFFRKEKYERYDFLPPGIASTKVEIFETIERAKAVFSQHDIVIKQGSSLEQLLSKAQRELLKSSGDPKHEALLVYAINLSRIFIGLANEKDVRGKLKIITKNDVDPFSKTYSEGKDTIWELECFSVMRMNGIDAEIREPDLFIRAEQDEYGVACKKIYSENSVEKCVKKGVLQIKPGGAPGIVALNIDNLVAPPTSYLYASHQDYFRQMLQHYSNEFITRHERTFKKYASSKGCDGFLISASRLGWVVSDKCFRYTTVNSVLSMHDETDPTSLRIDRFARKLSTADGLEDWLTLVGGTAFGL